MKKLILFMATLAFTVAAETADNKAKEKAPAKTKAVVQAESCCEGPNACCKASRKPLMSPKAAAEAQRK